MITLLAKANYIAIMKQSHLEAWLFFYVLTITRFSQRYYCIKSSVTIGQRGLIPNLLGIESTVHGVDFSQVVGARS